MDEYKSNFMRAFITIIFAFLFNKFLSIFRIRQLYLVCTDFLEFTSVSDNGYTVKIIVINKGKDKEEDVEIWMPQGSSCSLISSNYQAVTSENNLIKIDRVLPNEKLELSVLIEGDRYINKKNLPKIKSKDAKGKSYDSIDKVPVGIGTVFWLLTFFIFSGIFIFTSIVYDRNYILDFKKTYNNYLYDEFYKDGFELLPFKDNELIKLYNLSKKEKPIILQSVNFDKHNINYDFILFNNTEKYLKYEVKFEIYQLSEFLKKLSHLMHEKENILTGEIPDFNSFSLEELDEYKVKTEIFHQELRKLFLKYKVDANYYNSEAPIVNFKTVKGTLKPNSKENIRISRDKIEDLTMDDLNIEFKFASTDGEIIDDTFIFYSHKNTLSNETASKFIKD